MHDTWFDGLVPAERDAENEVVLYDTLAEAEAELRDAVEMRADAMRDAGMLEAEDEDDRWIEAAVMEPDGAVTLVGLGLRVSSERLGWVSG